MKIGIMDGCLKRPWEELFGAAAEIGFDGVELGVRFDDYAETLLWSADGRRTIAAQAAGGAEFASLCLHSFWQASFADPDESVRAAARKLTQEAAAHCGELGAKVMLLPVTPGPDVEPAEGTRRWIEETKACVPAAEEHRVNLALENVGRGYAQSAADLIELADGVGSPFVGVYYDIGNATAFGEDPVAEIKLLGDRIKQVHVKDREGELLGEGLVKIPECLRALQDIGYDGYLMLETPATDDPVAAGKANLEYLRALIG